MDASYVSDDLRIKLGFCHLEWRNIFPLEDVKVQLRLRSSDMNLNNSMRTWRYSTLIFYFESLEFLNCLKNIQKSRDAKYVTVVEFGEMEFTKGTGKEF